MYNNGFDNRMYPQGGMPTQPGMPKPPKPPKVTKKFIVEILTNMYNAQEVVQVDDFDSLRQRHICAGTKVITLLDKITVPVETNEGIVYAEVFFCPRCGKLIINKSSIEIF